MSRGLSGGRERIPQRSAWGAHSASRSAPPPTAFHRLSTAKQQKMANRQKNRKGSKNVPGNIPWKGAANTAMSVSDSIEMVNDDVLQKGDKKCRFYSKNYILSFRHHTSSHTSADKI